VTASGLSEELADSLHELGRTTMPKRTTEAAKDRLLHGIGVTLASSHLAAASVAWNAVHSDLGGCTTIGKPRRLSSGAAAFVNAVAAHNSLQEDCGPGGLSEGSHPGTYVLPAALAAAEDVDASGRDLLAAVVVGYEAVGLLGNIAPTSIVARRFRPLGVLGPIGAAAAAATLYGCTARQLAAALSIAANAAAGFGQGFVAGSMEPYLHAGYAARNGLLAASLAAAGATASPNSFEGPYGFFQTYGGESGRTMARQHQHAITRLGTKKFAACLQNQETLMLILERLPVPLNFDTVARVRLFRPATPNNGLASPGVGCEPPYHTMLQRQMSARFTAAAALLGRPIDDVRYFESAGTDEQVGDLATRVDLISTDEATVRIEVELIDETKYVVSGDMSGKLYPASVEIRERFCIRASPVIGGAAAEDVKNAVGTLELLPDITSLMRWLRPAAY
jgi:2-methylcitrate dehydratase PrpD